MQIVSIHGRAVGFPHSAFLIAEVSQNHEGSLGMAHAYIDAAAGMLDAAALGPLPA